MTKTNTIFNSAAAGKLTGMAIGTLATVKSRRSNSIVSVIAVAGAVYVGKRIIVKAQKECETSDTRSDFLGGLIIGLVGSAVAGAVITGLVGEPPAYPGQGPLCQ